MAVIEVIGLRRTYRTTTGIVRRRPLEVEAVRGISFEVAEGRLFGLLGPNGAGKTTTIKMLITLLLPTAGEARVLGHDVVRDAREVRKGIGYVFGGERGLYERLSGLDNLRYFAELYGVTGRRQRETIASLVEGGKTVLLTTHYMFEADSLCDRIAVIANGRIVAEGTPAELKTRVADSSVVEVEVFGVEERELSRIRELPGVTSVSLEERDQAQIVTIQSPRGLELTQELPAFLDGARIGRIAAREPTLEDAYVALVTEAGE